MGCPPIDFVIVREFQSWSATPQHSPQRGRLRWGPRQG